MGTGNIFGTREMLHLFFVTAWNDPITINPILKQNLRSLTLKPQNLA